MIYRFAQNFGLRSNIKRSKSKEAAFLVQYDIAVNVSGTFISC